MEMIINWSDEFEDHITATDDNEVEYQYNASVKRVNVTVEVIMLEIRRHEYPDCPFPKSRNLNSMETWIADGCWIDEETQAVKVPWTSTHPIESEYVDRKKISDETEAKLDNLISALLSISADAGVLKDILKGKE